MLDRNLSQSPQLLAPDKRTTDKYITCETDFFFFFKSGTLPVRVRNEQTTQGFFTKYLVGEDLHSEMIFGPHLEQSQMEGGLLSGTESDEGGLENIVPLQQNYSKFLVF